MKGPSLIHIGTSGWYYKHWKGNFYPGDMADDQLLGHYFNYFDSVEINNTFYQLPENRTFIQWRDKAPERFLFSIKASRYITHMKKLKDPDKPLGNMMERIELLGDKLGPLLFQLPPHWKKNLVRLNSFLDALPRTYRYAFEFRDESWFGKSTEEMLAQKSAAFCIFDLEGKESPYAITAGFIYVRLHGPHEAYKGRYCHETLLKWARLFMLWADEGREIFCYFDNDEMGYAVENALELKQLVQAG